MLLTIISALSTLIAATLAETCSIPTVTSVITTTAPTFASSTFDSSTCTPQSIAACPTSYDPCCAFVCAEAQVPFQICSPSNRTVLAQCSACPAATIVPTSLTSATVATTTSSPTITPSPTVPSPSVSSLSTSTCTGRLLSTAGCPTPYDPCCAWVCAEAQVPFDVCSQTDGSGEFAVCTQCPKPTSGL